MRSVSKVIASVLASAALVASSTAAVAANAATPLPQTAAAPQQAPNAWMMLSALGPTRAIALGGANAAAQPADVPPPPPAAAGGPVLTSEIIGFVVMFALIAIALTTSGESGAPRLTPISPA